MEHDLTKEQLELLQMMADGLTRHQIGQKLAISVRTVEWRYDQIRRKTGFRTIIGALVWCFRQKLIQ